MTRAGDEGAEVEGADAASDSGNRTDEAADKTATTEPTATVAAAAQSHEGEAPEENADAPEAQNALQDQPLIAASSGISDASVNMESPVESLDGGLYRVALEVSNKVGEAQSALAATSVAQAGSAGGAEVDLNAELEALKLAVFSETKKGGEQMRALRAEHAAAAGGGSVTPRFLERTRDLVFGFLMAVDAELQRASNSVQLATDDAAVRVGAVLEALGERVSAWLERLETDGFIDAEEAAASEAALVVAAKVEEPA